MLVDVQSQKIYKIKTITQKQIDSMQSGQLNRKKRFQQMRNSLQTNPIMKARRVALQNRIERRMRRQSVGMCDNLTQSQKKMLEEEDKIQVKAMTKFYQKYTIGDKIGEGSNGLVKKCYLKSTGELFALKAMKMDEEHILFLKNNFKQIHALDHQNIIKYRTMYLDLKNEICFLVMDYVIHPHLLKFKDLDESQIKSITQQLLDTVAYIHSRNICHRDIKPQNILFDRQNKMIKVIDFGISKSLMNRGKKKQMLTITGTLYYRAPEMFLGAGYDEKVDVWAVGITLYQLVTGKTPFQSQYLSTTIENISKGEIHFDDQVWDHFGKASKDLVTRLLKKREERLTSCQAKNHFWFNKSPTQNTDLYRSESLNIGIHEFSDRTHQKYNDAEDFNKYQSFWKVPNLENDKKPSIIDSESSDDSFIEIESQDENSQSSSKQIEMGVKLAKKGKLYNKNCQEVRSLPVT